MEYIESRTMIGYSSLSDYEKYITDDPCAQTCVSEQRIGMTRSMREQVSG